MIFLPSRDLLHFLIFPLEMVKNANFENFTEEVLTFITVKNQKFSCFYLVWILCFWNPPILKKWKTSLNVMWLYLNDTSIIDHAIKLTDLWTHETTHSLLLALSKWVLIFQRKWSQNLSWAMKGKMTSITEMCLIWKVKIWRKPPIFDLKFKKKSRSLLQYGPPVYQG